MPRCETCMAMRAKAEVRKLPGRDAWRCKDKWACMLSESKRDPWTATVSITYPALNEREANQIVTDVMAGLKPLPVAIIGVENANGPASADPLVESTY